MIGAIGKRIFEVTLTGFLFTLGGAAAKRVIDLVEKKREEKEENEEAEAAEAEEALL